MNASLPIRARLTALVFLSLITFACTKAPNDAKVTADIQSKLGADSGLQNKQINVQSAAGTVTLSGTVDSDAQREAASRYAASEPGVKTVINDLQVAPTGKVAQSRPSPAMPSSTSRKSQRSRHSSSIDYRTEPSAPQEQVQDSAPAAPSAPPAQTSTNAPVQAPAAPAPPPEPPPVTIPSGTGISVRLVDSIDSATAQTGDRFRATLDSPIAIDGEVAIPAHYDVDGHVVAAQSSGKFQGRALLELQLDRIKVGEHWYTIETDHFKQETGSRGKNTAEKVGAGAVAGAILGGIFGGGKGAAIGSAAGAGAGGGVQAASKKPDIKLASERILNFMLQAPVTIVPTTKPPREGHKLENNSGQ